LIVKYFHSNSLVTYLSLFIIALLIWLAAIYEPSSDVLPNSLISLIVSKTWLSMLLAFLINALCGFLINTITQNEEVVFDKQNQIPGLLYTLGITMIYPKLHEVLLVNLSILLAFRLLWSIYRSEAKYAAVFNLSFLLGLITLFYFYSLSLYLLLIIVLIAIKPLSLREIIFSILGFLSPIYLKYGLFYVTQINNTSIMAFFQIQKIPRLSFSNLNWQVPSIHAYIYIFLLVILSIWLIIQYQNGIKVKTLKSRNTLVFLSLFSFIFGLIIYPSATMLLALLTLPLSILSGDLISSIKNPKLANALLALFFINSFLYMLHQFGFLIYR
jgi:hypothetical protein